MKSNVMNEKRKKVCSFLKKVGAKVGKVTQVQDRQGPDFLPGVEGQSRKWDDASPLAHQQDDYGGWHLAQA